MTEKLRKTEIATKYSITMSTILLIVMTLIVAFIAIDGHAVMAIASGIAAYFVTIIMNDMIFYLAATILDIND